jgi:hypothetical protein
VNGDLRKPPAEPGGSESVYRDVPYLCHISVTMSSHMNQYGSWVCGGSPLVARGAGH